MGPLRSLPPPRFSKRPMRRGLPSLARGEQRAGPWPAGTGAPWPGTLLGEHSPLLPKLILGAGQGCWGPSGSCQLGLSIALGA